MAKWRHVWLEHAERPKAEAAHTLLRELMAIRHIINSTF